jgi:tol-pal system protein YbgF
MIRERLFLTAGLAGVLSLSGCAAPTQATRNLERRIERQTSNQGLVDMMNQIQQLQSEVQQLRGETEAITHGIDEVKKKQKALYLDLDRRMLALEGHTRPQQPEEQPLDDALLSAESVTDQTPDDEASFSDAGETETPQTEIPQEASSQSPELYTEQPPVEMAQPSSAAGATNEKAAYENVLETLKEGRYDTAIEQFNEFLVTYPSGKYTGNAQYWLAEAYYVTRNFQAAQDGFQKVLNDHPQSTKAPDALLKLGFIEYERANYVAARDTLYDVIKRYPQSSAARQANKRLSRMKSEKR